MIGASATMIEDTWRGNTSEREASVPEEAKTDDILALELGSVDEKSFKSAAACMAARTASGINASRESTRSAKLSVAEPVCCRPDNGASGGNVAVFEAPPSEKSALSVLSVCTRGPYVEPKFCSGLSGIAEP
jgi:hypothetical protein